MLKIRDALNEEMEFIRKQRVAAYHEHAQVIPADHWNALKKAILSTADTEPNVEVIVAELNGQIVGSVALFPPKMDAYDGYVEELDYPEIRMLAVAPDAQGKGVATSLISECIKRTKAKDLYAIGLHTGEFMKNAISLYSRMGFERLPQYDFVPANDGIVVKAFRLIIK
ncbi:acetyltransferase (GNAT) family protein [Bacillus oleivorans]|uniref:Acetyltransferase (GNAT) family protein n=1 Tax=Bacillus oleivorans TaxID=1448271 RepID=A0A285D8I1_9BACI|nr:GNAT family N-acetyltransferase [Bacillus oleivorans]SNX75588.1 acetyltransferase (GNAT) family protein [Bacillus oleivorans]